LKAAAARGRVGGRPGTEQELVAEEMRRQRVKIDQIVADTGVSRSTVNRILKAMRTRAVGNREIDV